MLNVDIKSDVFYSPLWSAVGATGEIFHLSAVL